MEYVANLQRLFKTWIKSSYIEPTYDKLSDLVFISRVLDTIDPKIYSYLMEQKPSPLEELINLGNKFCEAHGITKIVKPTIQTFQTGRAQTVYQNTKQNGLKAGRQHQNGTFKVDNRGNPNNDMALHLYGSSKKPNSQKDQQFKGQNVQFENPHQSNDRKLQSSLIR